jgi:asparagine synthase (glutamine-hydrolysing)
MPGNYLIVDKEGLKERNTGIFQDISEKDLSKDEQFIKKEFARLFDDSVRIRMRSDVKFGAFLSGGLDSSCVVSAMANHTSKPVQTFTMGFENKNTMNETLLNL